MCNFHLYNYIRLKGFVIDPTQYVLYYTKWTFNAVFVAFSLVIGVIERLLDY